MSGLISEKKSLAGGWLFAVMVALAAVLPHMLHGATSNASDDVALFSTTGGASWTNNTVAAAYRCYGHIGQSTFRYE